MYVSLQNSVDKTYFSIQSSHHMTYTNSLLEMKEAPDHRKKMIARVRHQDLRMTSFEPLFLFRIVVDLLEGSISISTHFEDRTETILQSERYNLESVPNLLLKLYSKYEILYTSLPVHSIYLQVPVE